jgi:DNA modification methylase
LQSIYWGKSEIFTIHRFGFEDFEITNLYDLVFTSPPYFDVEVYFDSNTQSIKKYPNKTQWYNEFLLPMFLRCWVYLKLNGHMVISINNVSHKNRLVFDCTERLVHDISKYCKNSEYLGVLSYGDIGKRMEPMFIWKKKALLK